jgi:hypothetical protein
MVVIKCHTTYWNGIFVLSSTFLSNLPLKQSPTCRYLCAVRNLTVCLLCLGQRSWNQNTCTLAIFSVVCRVGVVVIDGRFGGSYCLHHLGDKNRGHPDYEGSTHLWNVGLLQWDYTALYSRRLSVNWIVHAVRWMSVSAALTSWRNVYSFSLSAWTPRETSSR